MAKTNSAFMKPMTLSPELEAVVGKGPMPRSEIVSKMWVYIKAQNLQDPKDRRIIISDEKLLKVFGGEKTVHMMKMAGHISRNVS